jgi:hypothetical protein
MPRRRSTKICSFDGCGRFVNSRNLCAGHYYHYLMGHDLKPIGSRNTSLDEHGLRSQEYKSWSHMIQRCHNPKNPGYPGYGGRGISVCDRWRASFLSFLSDMGRRPTYSHSIDRIDNNLGYEPTNCRWATPAEQGRNKRNTVVVVVVGHAVPVIDECARLGISYSAIRARILKGWDPVDAISTPVRKHKPYEWKRNGKRKHDQKETGRSRN